MPYANSAGVHIYYETEGQEYPALMLAHGGTGKLEDWRKQGYTDDFKDKFQLILFDARVHGRSDRPHKTSISLMADDAIAVLNTAGVAKTHYWGYSMGSAVGLNLAVRYPSRFTSFIFGGISPYRWPDAIVKPLQSAHKALTGKSEADVALLSALIDRQPLSDNELSGIDIPCLFYCGDKDPFHPGAEECVRNMPNARFVSIAGANHAGIKAGQVIPHVKRFLDEIAES